MRKNSFPPIASPDAGILILGSMPGEMSLAAQQYYAHPRNAFWPIMGELFGAYPHLPYEDRLEILKTAKVAIWDVLEGCYRDGSLDSAITDEVPNDFVSFFAAHPEIRAVLFNGAKAEDSFRRHFKNKTSAFPPLYRVPSTSPAHAGKNLERKLADWKAVIEQINLDQ